MQPKPEMNSTEPEPRFNAETNGRKNAEFKIDIDPKLGQSLQGGVDAIQQLFAGFVNTIKESVGPDMLKNLSTAAWLTQVADSLEQIMTAQQAGEPIPESKSGEIACYLERLDAELKGSRVEGQSNSLRDRLVRVQTGLEQQQLDRRALGDAIGFFQAAAKSVVPIQFQK
jgi:hypothetical protein